jgi:hypothetical protein
MNDESKLFIAGRLADCLSDYRDEHDDTFAEPEGDDEQRLHQAINALDAFALRLVVTGVGVDALDRELESFMPGTNVTEKITSLLDYNLVRDRLQFAVARAVVDRLARLERRIRVATIAFALLRRANPSQTAVKYFERACHLFLAGYDGEVIVMCGAVVEAALKERIPDEDLRTAGIEPSFKRTGDYSIGQRMTFAKSNELLSQKERDLFWQIVNWRNNAVHVQPDIGPEPEHALLMTALLLGKLLPRII